MALTLYGIPGRLYTPLSGRRYQADVNGVITGVVDGADAQDLTEAGCIQQNAAFTAAAAGPTGPTGPAGP